MTASGINWAMWEAIGTVSAVVVALALAAGPAWNRRRKHPKLSLQVSDLEPHCIAIGRNLDLADQVVLRVEVRNGGKTAASNLSAKLNGHWIMDLPVTDADLIDGFRPYREEGWRLRDTEPVALRWASGEAVAIAPGQSEFVCLATLRPRDWNLTLAQLDPDHPFSKPDLGMGLARHRFRIVIAAHECEPIVQVVEFVVNGKSFFSQVSLTDEPHAEDTRLLRQLRKMAESPDELTPPAAASPAISTEAQAPKE